MISDVERSPRAYPQRRPAILVGGFVQIAEVALAVQQGLSDVAEVTVSTQGVSRLSGSLLDSLVHALDRSDCAVFVFTHHGDLTRRRSKQMILNQEPAES